ncbi:MAG TPA: RHS repeat-associated core domain-containing protein, partial [Terriglobia bacterium]|nr:RHS repeat-associated core domain-containing protein [Terriglobia bacterium]
QVLPAYGLQALPPVKPTPLPQTTPGGGSFYLAKYRNFLLCVDRKIGQNRSAKATLKGQDRLGYMDLKKCLTLCEKADTARRASAPPAYQWDAENRMLSVDSGSTATYKYNSLGQRVERYLPSGSYTFDYLFAVGGEELGLYSAGGATWFDQDVPMGRRVLVKYGSPLRMLHANKLGTTTVTTDQTGAELQDELFYPWGQDWTRAGQPYVMHFAGMQGFENPGLVYPTDFRRYNPALGRWMSPDPLAGDVTNPQSLNRYAYVLNNPVSNTDPQGLSSCGPDSIATVDTGGVTPVVSVTRWEPCPAPVYEGSVPGLAPVLPGSRDSSSDRGEGRTGANSKKGTWSCASEFASKYSIAGGLQALGIGKSGVGGFVTNALGGNVFSGATDLIQSFRSGEAGGHNVFYNMGQGVAAGPSLGFSAAFGNRLKGTPWASGPVDVATEAALSGAQRLVTGAGQTIQTLTDNPAVLGSVLGETGEWASGIGEAKIIYDAAFYFGGAAGCALGVVQ